MRTVLAILIGLIAAAPAAAAPCDTDAALVESLCRADRPLVSIQMSAASPRAGSVIDLEARSNGRRLAFAWDLDGDGAYDDATGATVARAFTTGQRTVAVRATDQFGRTSSEVRSFLVHDFNAAPSVDLDLGFGTTGAGEPLTIRAFPNDPDGRAPRVQYDLDGDGTYETLGGNAWEERQVTFPAPGTYIVRARVVDDAGATATATGPVQVVAPAPGVALNVVAGEPTRIEAAALGFDAVSYAFDLDGDGTYETDRGAQSSATAALGAGDHVVGVRATGAATTVTTRASVLVAPGTSPWGRFTSESRAYVGVPARLSLELFPAGQPMTVSWDTDDDGAFDDGQFGGAGEAWTGTAFKTPGVHVVRAKIVDGAGVSRVEHTTVTVTDPGATGPRFPTLSVSPARPVGQEWLLDPRAEAGTTLTFDLDGDGVFDETPSNDQYGYHWTFDAPATFAVKATDAGGRSSVRTQSVAPLVGNLGPQTGLFFLPQMFPSPNQPDGPLLVAGRTVDVLYELRHEGEPCCSVRWDTDGDGDYDDAALNRFTVQAREYTIGARVEDGLGAFGTVRDTFTAGTRPPRAAFGVDGVDVVAKATEPDGDALAALEWDLDGDRDFDDATGATARPLPGVHLVGLKATDAGGDIGIAYASVDGAPAVGETRIDPILDYGPAPRPQGPTKRLALKLAVGKIKLAALLSRGLTVKPGCELKCRATVVIAVDKKTAKRLKLRSTELGHAAGSGTTIKVKLSAKARKALRKARSVKFTVAVLATGADGRIGSADRTLTISR